MKMYAAIDLHSNNNVLVIQDENDRVHFSRRLPNQAEAVLHFLEPYREALQSVAVESTYNWYWLVDALMEAGYPVRLVHTPATKQYNGLKHSDDKRDAQWLNRLSRLGILPTGHIYPKAQRPQRDLARRRSFLVRQRTALLLSLHSVIARATGTSVTGQSLKQMTEAGLAKALPQELDLMGGASCLAVIQVLDSQISRLGKALTSRMRLEERYRHLLSVPGVGEVLGLTIRLEAGPMSRFSRAGRFASYCRLVNSGKTSNGKKKGEGNVRNGNPYLCWAFMEAAQHAMGSHEPARRFYERKKARTNPILARKALAHKLARAAYHVMRDKEEFDSGRLFG